MAKIKVNDNLTNIFNFIETSKEDLSYMQLIQYCLDYDLYQEFYLNNTIINRLYDERIKALHEKTKNYNPLL